MAVDRPIRQRMSPAANLAALLEDLCRSSGTSVCWPYPEAYHPGRRSDSSSKGAANSWRDKVAIGPASQGRLQRHDNETPDAGTPVSVSIDSQGPQGSQNH